MSTRPTPVLATGTLLRQHGPRTWIALLPNGAETLAHVPTWKLSDMPGLAPGDRVPLEMTQYDFSIARITSPAPGHSQTTAPAGP